MVEVVGVERLLRERERVGAQRRRALGAEPLDGAHDLGRVAGLRLALEERAVAREGLALGRGEPIVVPEVHGGGDQAVGRAAGEEERVEGGQERAAREDAERADRVVQHRGAAVVAVVGEQAVGGGGLVHLELVLGEAADERVGVRLEDRVQRLALRVARRDEPGRQIARVVGEAGRGEAGVPARLVARLQVRDVGGQQLAVPLEAMGGDQSDPLLDPRVGRGRLGQQVVGAQARGQREQRQERGRLCQPGHRYRPRTAVL